MSHLDTLVAPLDARIDIHDESDCRYWCAHFGIRPKRLKQIVHAVGNRVSDVDNYLGEAQLHAYFEEDNTEANPT
ncbi:MAG TPA: DUF3606 domain-containing protein [Burkholderiales bacterium]|nr:DUF3606 domain-containing protein [Burkholderiales bacterium]